MVGASKILTVSYGTFSCTLEGFDDSFSTMKAIAEYFRDLAADDRYFGAEPATPDADMLARIAEHEIKKRVEAKVGDNSVLLRASEEPTSLPQPEAENIEQEPVAEQPAPAEAIVQEAPVTPSVEEVADQPGETFAAPEPEIEITEPVAEAPATPFTPAPEGDSESVAAKLQRIRAVVARNQSAVSATPFFEEDEDADVFEAAPQEAAVEDADEAEVEQPVAEAAPAVEEEPVVEDVFEAEEEAVVEDAPAMEDEPAVEETLIASEEPVSEELVSKEAQQSDEEAESTFSEDAAFDDEAPVEASDLTALLGRVAGGDAAEATETKPEETENEGENQDLSAFVAAESESYEDDEEVFTEDETSSEAAEEEPSEEDAERLEAASAAAQRARARVIKMKSEDFEEAVSSGVLEDTADTDEDVDISQVAQDVAETEDTQEDNTIDSDLTPEQEAELMKELAEVEMEMEEAEKAPAERSGRAILDSASTEDEASVSRLMEETNSQLDSPETSRRRSAISHLRAAVAATVAERLMGSPKTDKPVEDEADAFRADLASVVRPSSRQEARKERSKDRPAPLVLVSEQRIDTGKDSSATSGADVRPRRVQKSSTALREVDESFVTGSEDGSSEANTNIFAENTSFGEFAEGTDATELPDLLEAAAAYTAFVQGLPHFTRPHVMRLVAQFQGDNQFSREEGLRAFGQLLRQGKILKTKRGQFEIADTTKFKPEARFAG